MYQYRTIRKPKKPVYKKPLLWIMLIAVITLTVLFIIYKNKSAASVPPTVQAKELKPSVAETAKTYELKTLKAEKIKPFTPDCDHLKYADVPIKPSSKLNDINDDQLVHALKNGLKKPFKTDKELFSNIENLKRKSILLEVSENNFYQFKNLTHSQPYLIPEAIDMLNEIGYRFQKKMEARKKNYFKYQITSLLRTEEEQTRLHHRNGNAASHSTHMYGTTVDISYKDFFNVRINKKESSFDAVQAMTKVLIEMRQECRLLCVRERHQSCFHITVVVCRPQRTKK